MKKIILFLIVLNCSGRLFGQNVPNSGFENWTSFGAYEMPDLWQTTDSFSMANGAHSATRELTDIYAGQYSLRLTPFLYAIFTIPGAASNGRINTSTPIPTIEGGSPDTVRHAQLQGWYKYTPVSNDSCSISVTMYKSNGSSRITVASGTFGTTAATAAYTQFGIDLTYYTTDTPDSTLIIVYSSILGASHMGTVLLVDDFSFNGVIGINEIGDVVNSLSVFPVPASNELNVDLDLKKNIHTSFEIMDMNGKRILSHDMISMKEKISIGQLTNGNYFYTLVDEYGMKLSSGKFSVAR